MRIDRRIMDILVNTLTVLRMCENISTTICCSINLIVGCDKFVMQTKMCLPNVVAHKFPHSDDTTRCDAIRYSIGIFRECLFSNVYANLNDQGALIQCILFIFVTFMLIKLSTFCYGANDRSSFIFHSILMDLNDLIFGF